MMDSLYKNIIINVDLDLSPRSVRPLAAGLQAHHVHHQLQAALDRFDPAVFEFYNTYSKQMSG